MEILQQLATRTSEPSRIGACDGEKMRLANLDERERDVVRQCLQAAVDGPFFPEWEFGIIFRLERDEVKQVLVFRQPTTSAYVLL